MVLTVKIDKKTLDVLTSLPDDQFVGMLRLFGSSAGIDIKSKNFSHEEVEKLRLTLRSLSENDVNRAMEIYEQYKRN